MTHQKLKLEQKIAIYNHLKDVEDHETETVGPGYLYQSDWSDAAVAEYFQVNRASVGYIRQTMFGKLAKPKNPVPPTPLSYDQITELLHALVDEVNALKERVSYLEANTPTNDAWTAWTDQFDSRLRALEKSQRGRGSQSQLGSAA